MDPGGSERKRSVVNLPAMAEAAVEEPVIPRFFCHKCSVEIPRILPDYKCPNCYSGFIEELESPPDLIDDSDSEMEDLNDRPDLQNLQTLQSLNQRLGVELGDMLLGLSRNPPERRVLRGRDRDGPDSRRPGRYGTVMSRQRIMRNSHTAKYAECKSSHAIRSCLTQCKAAGLKRHVGSVVTSKGSGVRGLITGSQRFIEKIGMRGPRTRQMQPIEQLIQDFLVNFTGVGFGTLAGGRGGQGPVFFLGNPGDYAWGREGLDAIVTQLLNQMDGTGPPPLTKEKIKEIPIVVITEDQVGDNLQCSVCWEDFCLDEPVRKLTCEHVYHENCIVPWLELHGTCPICRKTLSDDAADDPQSGGAGSGLPNMGANMGPSLAALFRAANDSSRNNSSSSSSSGSSSTPGGSGNHSSDWNMDLEYE